MSVHCGDGLAKKNYQCGVVCAWRIIEATSSSLEKEVYLYLTEVVVWTWIDQISTDQFKSADPCNRLGRVLIV